MLTKNLRRSQSAMGRARFNAEQDRVCQLLAREFALRARDRSAALITVAAAVIERYRAEKERHGLLDYEDLIDKALTLLGAPPEARRRPGCSTSSISASIMCSSTKRRTPATNNGGSSRFLVAEFLPGGARENVQAYIVCSR